MDIYGALEFLNGNRGITMYLWGMGMGIMGKGVAHGVNMESLHHSRAVHLQQKYPCYFRYNNNVIILNRYKGSSFRKSSNYNINKQYGHT